MKRCPTCQGTGRVRQGWYGSGSQPGDAFVTCQTCGGYAVDPASQFDVWTQRSAAPQRSGGRGWYDTLGNLECFPIGVVVAIAVWQVRAVVGIIGFFGGWLAALGLFMKFPRTFTGVFTLLWVVIAVWIAAELSQGDWLWMAFAGVVTGIASYRAHGRSLQAIRDEM